MADPNISFYTNEDPQFTVTMTPPESVVGWAVELTILDLNWNRVRTADIGSGVTVTDPTLGVFTVQFDALPAGVYHYLVTRTSPGRRVLAAGLVVMTRAS